MQFGMTGAVPTFHRNMAKLMEMDELRDYVEEKSLQWFFDDVIASSNAEAWQHHLDILRSLFKAARMKGWKFGIDKMKFAYQKLAVLGVVVTPAGIYPNLTKVDVLLSFRIPRMQSELRSYIGLAQWFYDNIPGVSFKTTLLSKMTAGTGNAILKWSPEALK
jgi:hypothetical protein